MFKGIFLALSTVFLWSFNIIYSKVLTPYLTPIQISFIRWLLAMFFFVPFTFGSIIKYRRQLWHNLEYIIILGLSGIGLLNTCVYFAGHTANAVDMSLIATLGPIFLIILSHFCDGESVSFRTLTGISLALIGVIVLILHGNFNNLKTFNFVAGDVWMLGAAVLFAVYAIVQKRLPAEIPTLTALSASIIVAVIFFTPLFLFQLETAPLHKRPEEAVIILLILGFMNSGVAYLMWNTAIRRIGLIRTGMIYYFMPVFSSITAYFWLHEKISVTQTYGALLVLAGVILVIGHHRTTLTGYTNKRATTVRRLRHKKLA